MNVLAVLSGHARHKIAAIATHISRPIPVLYRFPGLDFVTTTPSFTLHVVANLQGYGASVCIAIVLKVVLWFFGHEPDALILHTDPIFSPTRRRV